MRHGRNDRLASGPIARQGCIAARMRAPLRMCRVPIATLADEALPNVMRKVIAQGLYL
jgi:hypothetical protein